jgi:plasmid stabilization system protein ParE
MLPMSSGDKRYHIIFSYRAGEMLVQHVRFSAQVSTEAAEKLRIDVVEAAELLQDFPERGSWLSDPVLPANKYRKMLVNKRYLLIYQIKDDTVFIEYIVDCRSDYIWLL